MQRLFADELVLVRTVRTRIDVCIRTTFPNHLNIGVNRLLGFAP
jgi:hypothetical protein